jgi:hypothetical protein
MLVARTVAEAHLYMDLLGCSATRQHDLVARDGALFSRYTTTRSGESLTLEFEVLDPHAGLGETLSLGGDTPSTLIDPGEFVLYSDLVSRRIPATTVGMDDEERTRSGRAIALAAACLLEAAKFVPLGAPAIPDTAFTSERGRQQYEAEPGRFGLERLQAAATALTNLARGFLASPEGAISDRIAAAVESVPTVRARAANVLSRIRVDLDEGVAGLRPRNDDDERAFDPAVGAIVRAFYEPMWDAGVAIEVPGDHLRTIVHACVASLFIQEVEAAREFPGGYRRIRPYLRPYRVWVCWRWVPPHQTTGLSFDGLVWLDDHWAWFPRPYRALVDRPPIH